MDSPTRRTHCKIHCTLCPTHITQRRPGPPCATLAAPWAQATTAAPPRTPPGYRSSAAGHPLAPRSGRGAAGAAFPVAPCATALPVPPQVAAAGHQRGSPVREGNPCNARPGPCPFQAIPRITRLTQALSAASILCPVFRTRCPPRSRRCREEQRRSTHQYGRQGLGSCEEVSARSSAVRRRGQAPACGGSPATCAGDGAA